MPILNRCVDTLFGDSERTAAIGGEGRDGGVASSAKQISRGIGHILQASGDIEVALTLVLVVVVGAGDAGAGLEGTAGSDVCSV